MVWCCCGLVWCGDGGRGAVVGGRWWWWSFAVHMFLSSLCHAFSLLPSCLFPLLPFVSSSSSLLLFLSFRGIVGAEQLYHAARTIRGIGHALFSTHIQHVYGWGQVVTLVNLRCKCKLVLFLIFFFKVVFFCLCSASLLLPSCCTSPSTSLLLHTTTHNNTHNTRNAHTNTHTSTRHYNT